MSQPPSSTGSQDLENDATQSDTSAILSVLNREIMRLTDENKQLQNDLKTALAQLDEDRDYYETLLRDQKAKQSNHGSLSRATVRREGESLGQSSTIFHRSRSLQSQLQRSLDTNSLVESLATMDIADAGSVVKRNQMLMQENESLRYEVSRLREENKDLLLFAKDTQADARLLHSQVIANQGHRRELEQLLSKTKQECKRLNRDMDGLAYRFTAEHQQDKQFKEFERWSRMTLTPSSIRSQRRLQPPTSKTRNIRVEDW